MWLAEEIGAKIFLSTQKCCFVFFISRKKKILIIRYPPWIQIQLFSKSVLAVLPQMTTGIIWWHEVLGVKFTLWGICDSKCERWGEENSIFEFNLNSVQSLYFCQWALHFERKRSAPLGY